MSSTTVSVAQSQTGSIDAQKGELGLPIWKANFWLMIMTLIYTTDFANRFIIAATLPAIKKEFELTDASAGLLGGILYFSMFLLVIPCGLLVDRWSRKYIITIMVTVWSAATYCTSLARSFPQLLLSCMGVGAGEAGYNPASYALIGAYFPASQRATKVGLFALGQTLGAILGFGVAGVIAQQWGWRMVFGIFAVPGFILGFLMLFAPDYKTRKVGGGQTAGKPSSKEILHYILTTRTLLLLFIVQSPIFFYIVGLSVWVPSFFGRCYGLDLAQAGKTIMVMAICYCLGPFFGGRLSDKLAAGNPKGRITAALVCLTIPMVFYSVGLLGGYYKINMYVVAAAITVAQFFFTGHYGSLIAAALDLVPIPYRGTGQSIVVIFQTLVAFFSGVVIGALSDQVGLPLALWTTMIICTGLALIILAMGYKSYNRDYAKKDTVGKFELEVA
jgi:MFS family permease